MFSTLPERAGDGADCARARDLVALCDATIIDLTLSVCADCIAEVIVVKKISYNYPIHF